MLLPVSPEPYSNTFTQTPACSCTGTESTHLERKNVHIS